MTWPSVHDASFTDQTEDARDASLADRNEDARDASFADHNEDAREAAFPGKHESPRKTVFLDRDGVINRLERGNYVTSWERFQFLRGVLDAIARLHNAGFMIIVITNQSAVNRGLMTSDDLEDIHSRMLAEIEEAGGRVEAVYHCPHRPDENCQCRKPETGMFDRANEKFNVDYDNSWFVGDFESDRKVAEKMGLRFILAKGDNGLRKAVSEIIG